MILSSIQSTSTSSSSSIMRSGYSLPSCNNSSSIGNYNNRWISCPSTVLQRIAAVIYIILIFQTVICLGINKPKYPNQEVSPDSYPNSQNQIGFDHKSLNNENNMKSIETGQQQSKSDVNSVVENNRKSLDVGNDLKDLKTGQKLLQNNANADNEQKSNRFVFEKVIDPIQKETPQPLQQSTTINPYPAQLAFISKKQLTTTTFPPFLRYTTTNVPTAKSPEPRVDVNVKKIVEWSDMTNYYQLKFSADTRFRIRYAPIPLQGSPWPLPQYYLPSNTSYHIDVTKFRIRVVGDECPLLTTAIERIRRNVFGDQSLEVLEEKQRMFSKVNQDIEFPEILNLTVRVANDCEYSPHLHMNESYEIRVARYGIRLQSKEVWGALRGLETISQLIYQDDFDQFWINRAYIRDFPRFKHRGVLLDTSRHFLDKSTIIENLEAMAQNKMNVFHWHIVDDQSFPFESKTYPNLTKLGAFDPVTHVYTQEVIAEIIEEARVRGIRVIPEFDTPGHTFSWGFGQSYLLTPCYDYKRNFNGMYGPINPILKRNYRFLRNLFKEIMSVFKDKYIHLGGDEVPFDCWYSNPSIQNFMKRNNIKDMKKILSLYAKELLKIVSEIGSTRTGGSANIVWQEMFDNDVKLSNDTIVQVWSGDAYSVERVIKSGLGALFSTCWYLDYINYGQDWDKYYRCEQMSYHMFSNESLLYGGEVCLWAEYVDDDGIMPRLWPRASAAAERLWSSKLVMNVHAAAPRIEAQRCRMMERGIRVGVLSGPGYCAKHNRERKKKFVYMDLLNISSSAAANNVKIKITSQDLTVIENNYKLNVSQAALFLIACSIAFVLGAFCVLSNNSRLFTHCYPFSRNSRLFLVFLIFVTVWLIWTAPVMS